MKVTKNKIIYFLISAKCSSPVSVGGKYLNLMLEHRILHICNFGILLFCFEYLEFQHMQVLTDVQKGMALLSWGLSFTHRLLGIRMPMQR